MRKNFEIDSACNKLEDQVYALQEQQAARRRQAEQKQQEARLAEELAEQAYMGSQSHQEAQANVPSTPEQAEETGSQAQGQEESGAGTLPAAAAVVTAPLSEALAPAVQAELMDVDGPAT